MDRRLLFPAIAMTAVAQQTSPAAAEAEKALRARAEQFFQLEVNKDFRHAEAMVAEESKDYFYNANKPEYKGFSLMNVELLDNNTRAKVTIKVKAEVFFPGVGAQIFDVPATSDWKFENGQWCWYFDKDAALNTPFGRMKPGPGEPTENAVNTLGKAPTLATLEAAVSISRDSVTLTKDDPVQFVTISNNMPGLIGLQVTGTKMDGVTVEVETNELKAGQVGGIRFRLTGDSKTTGLVRVTCSPLGQQFDVQVRAN